MKNGGNIGKWYKGIAVYYGVCIIFGGVVIWTSKRCGMVDIFLF
jgi:hypothetical protein